MSGHKMKWEWNPSYAGPPRILEPACHDRSPMVDVKCSCGETTHVHETAIVQVPADYCVATRCPGCHALIEFGPGELPDAFAALRKAGWLA